LNEHIHQIEKSLALHIRQRGNAFQLSGDTASVTEGARVLELLYRTTADGTAITPDMIHLTLRDTGVAASIVSTKTASAQDSEEFKPILIKTPHVSIKPRGKHQRR
jgi:phosphate starvation-inducible PhoH-like protein